jgi:hypothetical protein
MTDLKKQIQDLRPWFHNFEINGIRTRPIYGNEWSDNYPANLWQIIKGAFDAESE